MAKLMRVLVWPDGDVTRADLDTDGTREYVREAVASGATVVEDGEGLYYQAHPRAATAAAYQGVRS